MKNHAWKKYHSNKVSGASTKVCSRDLKSCGGHCAAAKGRQGKRKTEPKGQPRGAGAERQGHRRATAKGPNTQGGQGRQGAKHRKGPKGPKEGEARKGPKGPPGGTLGLYTRKGVQGPRVPPWARGPQTRGREGEDRRGSPSALLPIDQERIIIMRWQKQAKLNSELCPLFFLGML